MGNGIYLSKDGQVIGPIEPAALDEMRRSGELSQYAWVWMDGATAWAPISAPPPPPARVQPTAPVKAERGTEEIVVPPAQAKAPAAKGKSAEPSAPAYDVPDAPWSDLERTSPSMTINAFSTVVAAPKVIQRFGFGPTAKSPAKDDPTIAKEELARFRVICHNDRELIGGQLTRASSGNGILIGPASRRATGAAFKRGAKVTLSLVDSVTGRAETVQAVVEGTVRHDNLWEYRLRWNKAPLLLKAA